MKSKIFAIFLLLAIIFFSVMTQVDTAPNAYSGHEVFYTEAEYSYFKQALVESGATWSKENMNVLSSAPPIIVDFPFCNFS